MPTRRSVLAAAGSVPFVLAGAAAAAGKPLRYLQIGTGHAHANKIEVYADSPDWEVVGIVEEDPALLEVAKKHAIFGKFPFLSLEEGLATPGLEVVGVETKVRDLLRYTRVAVDGGFHAHLDKPAGASLAEYREIMKTADAKGLVVQMGFMYRFNPAVQLLHRMLEAGWLGEVFEAHAVMSKLMPTADRKDVAEFPGGTMFELGCHIIDLTVGVLGKPDKVVAYPRRTVDHPDDTLVDNMLSVFEYPKATATVRTTGIEVEGGARRHFTVCGTQGTFHIQPLDRPSVTVSLSQERRFGEGDRVFPKGTSTVEFGTPYSRYVGDAADFAAIIRKEKTNPYPSSHDLAVQEAVLAAAGM